MDIDNLPPYIYHDIEFEDGTVVTYRFFLSINRDVYGKWSAGYVKYADDETDEMAIPQLVTNSSESLKEVGFRMKGKVERFNKKEV